jgi:hypothetical protein
MKIMAKITPSKIFIKRVVQSLLRFQQGITLGCVKPSGSVIISEIDEKATLAVELVSWFAEF